MHRMTVNKVGKYKPFIFFELFKNTMRQRLPKFAAEKFKGLLLDNIDSNKFGFKLSDRWLAYKKLRGWDQRPFIAEGHYVDAISVFHYNGHLTIGFKKSTRHPRSKMMMYEVAQILEFGRLDQGIPARPLWRYTAEEFFKRFPEYIKEILPRNE